MATLYVLDAPEFAALVGAARNSLDVGKNGDYFAVRGEEIRISRKATGLRKAVWYGALTGGFEGALRRFDDDELVIG
jgi:hypothetical protein